MNSANLIQILIPFLWFQASSRHGSVNSFPELPAADRYFHLYALPVGQGDSFILQCPLPGGEVSVFDMGSTDYNRGGKLWSHNEVYKFLNKSFHKVRNVLVTHNHLDHLCYLNNVFNSTSSVQSIENIYISCNEDHLPPCLSKWLNSSNLINKLVIHNNGLRCGLNETSCRPINLCPNSRMNIEAKILMANWGRTCGVNSTTNNANSQVVRLTVGNVKVLLNGDFEDFEANSTMGPLRRFVNYYNTSLASDVYQLSHHGASKLANKGFLLDAVRPKAVFVSSNPYHQHAHPRCSVLDHLINISSLCKPMSVPGNPSYCGHHPADDSNRNQPDMKLQKIYTCGENEKPLRNVTDNEYAIYTTVPNENITNLIEFKTDGIDWGFTNNFTRKLPATLKRGRDW